MILGHLLIDDNYDGETFSDHSGVYTANLIRFKYKNDIGNPTYEFIAYSVNGLKISSGADETTSVSEFTGLVEILDYKMNSDENSTNSDNIYDFYDLRAMVMNVSIWQKQDLIMKILLAMLIMMEF